MAKQKNTLPEENTEVDELLEKLIKEFLPKVEGGSYYGKKLDNATFGKKILAQNRETQAKIVGVVLDKLMVLEEKIAAFRLKLTGPDVWNVHHQPGWFDIWNPRWVLMETLRALLRRDLPLPEADVVRLLEWPFRSCEQVPSNPIDPYVYPLPGLAAAAENFVGKEGISPRVTQAAKDLIEILRKNTRDKECRKVADRLQVLVSGGPEIYIEPGEAWADAALADLKKMKRAEAKAWNLLLLQCQQGGAGKLTSAWQKNVQPLTKTIGFASLKEHLLRWFPLVDKPRTQPIERQNAWEPDYNNLIKEPHVELLRGLVWCCGLQEDADLARALMRLAISAYRKIPGRGPRLVSLGNACVTALGTMPGLAAVGQLAILKIKVKFGTAQKEIAKAFQASATRAGLPAEEIEEMAIPTYGLEEVGLRCETVGDYQAELAVDGSAASLHWSKEGKPLKSVPAALKKEHAEEMKELQAALKDVNAMLPAQRERLDTLYLARKSWPPATWRERYLDHPLLGTIARRLIWSFTSQGQTANGIWHDRQIVDVRGQALDFKDDSTVALWHPIGHATEEVLAWRDWLERREVVQPFKQAHREIYLLTAAELRTGTYSNRFAAHILRQHQFNALCAARGWKNKLRLMVDDTYPPAHRLLPAWNLRAEYWVEGAGTEYGQDTNESGVHLYLVTDQVRFYPIDASQMYAHAGGGGYGPGYQETAADPLAINTLPPLVFSEIMRDVDLFVGVASVGNDPNWADGGPGGGYLNYWHDYSFGDLSATAQTRHALLERLLPRLKIADRCTLADRFLVVRGDLRTYKIHLGSGNILMLPNDQYLCIVPKQMVASQSLHERVFLPFEGDGMLSVILSKAFMLAADTRITDPTIIQQLR